MSKEKEQQTCFVVSPIGQEGSPPRRHADWVFNGIIRPVFEKHYPAFKVERADKITEPGQINSQVIDRLLNSTVVIADLSFLNANVFYELGIRHMAEKPIIHMQRVGEDIPFDVSIYRAIKFSLDEFEQLETAKGHLERMLADVLRTDHKVDNPVTEARGRVKLKETATGTERIVLDDIARLQSRIDVLESSLLSDEVRNRNALLAGSVITREIFPPKNERIFKFNNKRALPVLRDNDEVTLRINTNHMNANNEQSLKNFIMKNANTVSTMYTADGAIEVVGGYRDLEMLVRNIQNAGLAEQFEFRDGR